MGTSTRLLQIYKMADILAQESTLRLLAHIGDLDVDGRTWERGSYLFVESADEMQARTVYEFVLTVDPLARLVQLAKDHDDDSLVYPAPPSLSVIPDAGLIAAAAPLSLGASGTAT